MRELVAGASDGDARAWEQLVDGFAGLVWSVVRGHNIYGAEAADICQTVWLRLVEHLGRLREPERTGAWLATTARHECLRVLRRSGRSIAMADPPESTESGIFSIATLAILECRRVIYLLLPQSRMVERRMERQMIASHAARA